MRVITLIFLTVLLFSSCDKHPDKIDLKGSWYYDFGEWGQIDTTINYVELYFGDSILYGQDEVMGHGRRRMYTIVSDSIYYGDDSNDLKPFYKIIGLKLDTLWLKANPKILNNQDTVFYVRLPSGEYGHFDLTWTPENTDSLKEKVLYDYNRRMWKYHSFKSGNMNRYDSLEALGYWKWNMKEIEEARDRERDYLNRKN